MYELTIVLPGSLKDAKKRSFSEKIQKLLTAEGGRIEKTDDWGVVEMAHAIGNETSGHYLQYDIELKSAKPADIVAKLKMDSDIMRYLLVKTE